MQKIINVLAIASTLVSAAVVGTGAYVYVNKDAIIESVTEKALGGLGGFSGGAGALGGSLGAGSLGGSSSLGAPDLSLPNDSASAPPAAAPFSLPN